jgi:hypothetical protein
MVKLNINRVQLFNLESCVSRRITELTDFVIQYPHMKHIGDEQLAIYNPLHTEILNAIAEGTPANL